MSNRDEKMAITPLNEPGVDIEVEGKRFYLQNQYILLTYREWLHKESYIEWFKEKVPSTAWIRLANETGDEKNPYEHTHVVADLGKRFQTTNSRFFDFDIPTWDDDKEEWDYDKMEFIHPHIKKLLGKKPFEDAKKYIAKEDKDNQDLKEKPNWVKGVMNEQTAIDAVVKYAQKPSDVQGILTVHSMKDGDYRIRTRPSNNEEITLRPWQQKLHDIVTKTPDDRTVMWIFDKDGECGKTVLGKYLEDKYPKQFFLTPDLGTSYHAATIIEQKLESGWLQQGIFINLSRKTEHHDRMYSYIEEIKDGSMVSQKYRGKVMRFDPPHVVIFANYMPMTSNLSLDRWDIRKLVHREDGEIDMIGPLKIKSDREFLEEHRQLMFREEGYSETDSDTGEQKYH